MCSCVGTHTLGTLTGKQLPLAQWLSLVLQTHILIAFPFLAWLIVADLHTCAIYALEEGTATHSSTVAWRIPMDRGAWQATVYGVAKSRAQQKQLSTHTHYISRWLRGKNHLPSRRRDPWVRKTPLEKDTATHSSILAWEIPWTEGPDGLHSKGLQKSWTQSSD